MPRLVTIPSVEKESIRTEPQDRRRSVFPNRFSRLKHNIFISKVPRQSRVDQPMERLRKTYVGQDRGAQFELPLDVLQSRRKLPRRKIRRNQPRTVRIHDRAQLRPLLRRRGGKSVGDCHGLVEENIGIEPDSEDGLNVLNFLNDLNGQFFTRSSPATPVAIFHNRSSGRKVSTWTAHTKTSPGYWRSRSLLIRIQFAPNT